MPVQTDINSLSATPASNSPAGGEAANLVDDYLRQASAHIATLRDSKQSTLASGSTIKTVNGESLLGSGNVSTISTVQTFTASGAIGGWGRIVTVSSTSPVTLTLPAATTADVGKTILVRNGNTGVVTVNAASGTFNYDTGQNALAAFQALEVQCVGADNVVLVNRLSLVFMPDGSVPMSGVLRALDGTTAAPGMAFVGATTTGFARTGTTVSLSVAAAEAITFGVGSVTLRPANPGTDYASISASGGLLSLLGDSLRIDSGSVVRMGLSGAANTDLITSRTNGIAFNRFVVGRFDMRGSSPSNIGTTTTSGTLLAFYSDNGSAAVSAGGISVSGSTTTYATASDARLKVNIADSADAGAILDAIRVRQFDWRGNDKHERYGFIAQELMAHAPEAVAMPHDDDGYFGVDASKLVPMLVKEIQSLRRRVATLEAAND